MRWNQGPRESIDRAVARRHSGAEPSDAPPPSAEDRAAIRSMRPRWRRGIDWIHDFHKFCLAVAGLCGITIAVHVWLKGLITRSELEVAVEASVEKAVVKALLEARGDISDLKTATSGLPAWRAEVTVTIGKLDERLQAASKQGEKNERRIDSYLVVARGGR